MCPCNPQVLQSNNAQICSEVLNVGILRVLFHTLPRQGLRKIEQTGCNLFSLAFRAVPRLQFSRSVTQPFRHLSHASVDTQ